MNKSIIDKMFFTDKIETDVIVDFGCADGSLLNFVHSIYPEIRCVGYDIEQEMIDIANKTKLELDDTRFTSSFEEVKAIVRQAKDMDLKVSLLLSSVIHEVYAYGLNNVDKFWKDIYALDVDFIIIRDMCVSKTASHPADLISVTRVKQIFDKNKIAEFEQYWGSLEENWSLTHFLLKYKYEENWNREVRENYLPINKEDLLQMIPRNYFPDFVEHYTLPYIRNEVRKDFGIELNERTHIKLIFRKV